MTDAQLDLVMSVYTHGARGANSGEHIYADVRAALAAETFTGYSLAGGLLKDTIGFDRLRSGFNQKEGTR